METTSANVENMNVGPSPASTTPMITSNPPDFNSLQEQISNLGQGVPSIVNSGSPQEPRGPEDEPAQKKQKISATKKKIPTVASLTRLGKQELSYFQKWTAQDDFYLKNFVELGMSPEDISKQSKFSTNFSAKEIMERWKVLLYDEKIADSSAKSIIVLLQTNNKRVPWSEEEDKLIFDELKKKGYIGFSYLLDKNRDIFHPCRTVKSLEAHFYRLKRTGAFDNINHLHHAAAKLRSETIESFAEFERDIINSSEPGSTHKKHRKSKEGTKRSKSKSKAPSAPATITTPTIPIPSETTLPTTTPATTTPAAKKTTKKKASKEKTTEKKNLKRKLSEIEEKKEAFEIVKLEKEHSSNSVDDQNFATLEGRKTIHLITKENMVIGRSTHSQKVPVDIDISSEGNASKVSRKQAIIKMKTELAQTEVTTVCGVGPPLVSQEQIEDDAEIFDKIKTTSNVHHRKSTHIYSKKATGLKAKFFIENIGKRDIMLNGQELKAGEEQEIFSRTIIEFPSHFKLLKKVPNVVEQQQTPAPIEVPQQQEVLEQQNTAETNVIPAAEQNLTENAPNVEKPEDQSIMKNDLETTFLEFDPTKQKLMFIFLINQDNVDNWLVEEEKRIGDDKKPKIMIPGPANIPQQQQNAPETETTTTEKDETTVNITENSMVAPETMQTEKEIESHVTPTEANDQIPVLDPVPNEAQKMEIEM